MEILVFTAAAAAGRAPGDASEHPARAVIPSLELLGHNVRRATTDVRALMNVSKPDVVVVDARADLLSARSTCRMLRAGGLAARLIVVVDESGLAGLSADWGIDDFVLPQVQPAELAARLRLAEVASPGAASDTVRVSDLVIELTTYAAKIKGRPLDLTYKEFELLRFLAQHPGRVFTREQLLREVWGYDYFGGTRTVDVHIRRLRAKLGSEHEGLIGTVRQVGYKLVVPPPEPLPTDESVAV